ncbi:hypothetical protein CEP48_06675 [Mergibacter septicus]|uniref:Prepilin type IV endopeptidase peptidase domain-containing protein n=1 Tax=Mergibacter septicus TaxID=221402 RepID=A0A8D4IYW4_9PAST|nr:prepilin peptidase [Mergibacter septicus]AWX15881.1 hypothetical protein CEP47_06675 [Mergibacter septicus]QDJ15134.1 hypothetical protein CEP48_06675 [Mergibacter septicus]UTU47442.1 prepilin peptidase [Mergibacter septicus]WMR95377.1 prepilin peptidase [Mergibacter septicus]
MELISFLFIVFSLVSFGISIGYLGYLTSSLIPELSKREALYMPKLGIAHFSLFSIVSLLIFIVAYCQTMTPIEQFILFSFYLLLWLIAFIDLYYRLISLFHCFLVLIAGLYLVQFELLPLSFSLSQSLLSITLTLLLMGIFYFICRLILKREGFGFGDVVLASATATVLTWQVLGYYLFFACLTALVMFIFSKDKITLRQKGLPFAPFLNLSAGLIFNLQSYLVIVPNI